MNRNSLLAVALIAMVCTGLGVASVSDSQLPADVKDRLQVLHLFVTDTGNNTAVVTAMMSDGEDEHSFVFDPNEPLPEGFDPITDEDGNVIGASYNVTDESGKVVGGAAFGTITITDDDLPEGFNPMPDRLGAYNVTTDEDGKMTVTDKDGNVIGWGYGYRDDMEENNGGF